MQLATLGSIVVILGLGVLGALEIVAQDIRLSDELFGVLFTLYLLGAALLILFRLAVWSRGRLPAGDAPTA